MSIIHKCLQILIIILITLFGSPADATTIDFNPALFVENETLKVENEALQKKIISLKKIALYEKEMAKYPRKQPSENNNKSFFINDKFVIVIVVVGFSVIWFWGWQEKKRRRRLSISRLSFGCNPSAKPAE